MHEQLKFLIELQEIDSAILSMAERIEQLPRTLNKFKAPLKEANDLLQKSKTKYEVLNKKKKDRNMQLDDIQDKINKLKSRSNEIKTNKEYNAHLKEIEVFGKNIYKIEDEILAIMEEVEAFDKIFIEEEMKVKKAEDEFKHQEKILLEEQQKLQVELEKEKARRNDFASRIEKEYYAQYMVLLKRLGDKAVAETKNEMCHGCNTNIPPQLYNDIRKSERIYNCFYCNRFLYFVEPAPAEDKSHDLSPSS